MPRIAGRTAWRPPAESARWPPAGFSYWPLWAEPDAQGFLQGTRRCQEGREPTSKRSGSLTPPVEEIASRAPELRDLVGHAEPQQKAGALFGDAKTGRDLEGRAVRSEER